MPHEPNFPYRYLLKEVSPRTLAKKLREGICKHHSCPRPSRQGGRDCETCKSRLRRFRHQTYYAFEQVRRSAQKRDIPFDLTLEEFKEFDRQTGYVKSKGCSTDSLTIDRIDAAQGYNINNIRVLTFAANCTKLINGMTDPVEPIAKAMGKIAGDDNWYGYKKLAEKVLTQVELIQAQRDGGFEPKDKNPF